MTNKTTRKNKQQTHDNYLYREEGKHPLVLPKYLNAEKRCLCGAIIGLMGIIIAMNSNKITMTAIAIVAIWTTITI